LKKKTDQPKKKNIMRSHLNPKSPPSLGIMLSAGGKRGSVKSAKKGIIVILPNSGQGRRNRKAQPRISTFGKGSRPAESGVWGHRTE